MKFHHVGIACKDLEKTKEWVKLTHTIQEEKGPVFDKNQNATFITLHTTEGLMIELISGEIVLNLIKKGISLYHICYLVNNLDDSIAKFKENGAILVKAANPAKLFDNQRIAFINTPIGLIELLEEIND